MARLPQITGKEWVAQLRKEARGEQTQLLGEDDNTTHTSGRKHAYTQDWDSKEDEALGMVDDSVAHPLDPESDGEVKYDSDGEWRPADEEKPRSKSAMARERLEEERKRKDPAELERRRWLMMIPSDDEDEDGRPPMMEDMDI